MENPYDTEELLETFEMVWETGTVEVEDGCTVEPDGTCPHGYESPLLIAGMI